MQLFVKTLMGKVLVLEVDPNDGAEAIKQKVLEKEGVPVEKQRVLFGGKELKDGTPISAGGVQKEATVTLIVGKAGEIIAPGADEAADEGDEEFAENEEVEMVEMTRGEAIAKGLISASGVSKGAAGKAAAKKKKDLGHWDDEKDPVGSLPKVLAGLALVACIITITLTFESYKRSEGTDDTYTFDRLDHYSPGAVALKGRWFSLFLPFEPNNYYDLQNPQLQPTCIDHTILRSYKGAKLTGPNAIPEYECRFEVPYVAVWAAMSSSLFAFAVVAFYANDVLSAPRGNKAMSDLSTIIHNAAMEFLHQEYKWLLFFVLGLALFLLLAIDGPEYDYTPAATISFLFGAALSAACGYMGMHLATQGNCRTAAACWSDKDTGLSAGLAVAFRTGACMGLGVVACGLFGLTLSYAIFANTGALSGFGFGSSAVALFARVGGGIYTKAADVGADLCGKVDNDLKEDSPKNPATIADCVGDNVGDVAGMGSDLFESYVGSVVAACVLGASEFGKKGVALPLYIAMIGMVVSVPGTSFIRVKSSVAGKPPSLSDLLGAMRLNVMFSSVLIVVACAFLHLALFEEENDVIMQERYPIVTPENRHLTGTQTRPGLRLFGCMMIGLTIGIIIGAVTEYFTSHVEDPTQSIGRATEYGPGPVIIQGLGMGMYSTVVPTVMVSGAILATYHIAGMYGIAIACVGMLSTLGVTMSTDAYGPVSDNAGGIAEMCELPEWVRDTTDALDALGNTTAATGKGFANGSAVLSAVSTLTAFARVAEIEEVDMLSPLVVVGVLIGAMLPFLFSAMTMLSVNKAAKEMMHEVRRQFTECPDILKDDGPAPDYARCIAISCQSSLREMLMPGVLAVSSPLVIGFLFGSHCLTGMLVGSICSGYLLGVQMSNTGGAWDNAKKWIEAGGFSLNGQVQGKGTDCHKAAVCGDTVGDPFKDTSGPALNILIKLMTRFAFVLAPIFRPGMQRYYVGIFILTGVVPVVLGVYFTMLRDKKQD